MSGSLRIPMSAEVRDGLHQLYQHLHRHPELSMAEHATAALIADRLRGLGYETHTVGPTGVAAFLRNSAGPVVAFRADTDGLPVREATGLPYASEATATLPDGAEVPVMHACGHDMHVTCAMGAATLLAESRHLWAGTAVFLFQPGEETAAGAASMLSHGLWDKVPAPEVIFGQHVWPGRAGQIQLTSGPAMAMADAWEVVVKGRGGHGSRPEDTIDPIVLAAHMLVRIQSIVSREIPAQEAAVVTAATFHAGHKENIIPSEARFTLNIRSIESAVREHTLAALRRVVSAEALASGAPEPTITELYSFPSLVNDPIRTEAVRATFASEFGDENVLEVRPQMASEDFGHLPNSIGVPGVYWFFGGMPDAVVDGDEPPPSNHSPFFAPEIEPTLTMGVDAAVAAMRSVLRN